MIRRNLMRNAAGVLLAAVFLCGINLLFPDAAAAQPRGRQIWRDVLYGNRGNLARVAESRGRNDGYREGLKDGRNRKRYDPYGKSRYKKGTNGYSSRMGSRDMYRRYYRQAFIRGYREGYYQYRQGRRGW